MEKLEVFRAALGLSEPWQVTSAEFDAEQGQLDVYLDFARGAQFPGPEGDEDACPVHDTESKTWRHFDFFQHRAYVHARVAGALPRPRGAVGHRAVGAAPAAASRCCSRRCWWSLRRQCR